MKIGITGMIGFVGTHLKDRLSREQNIEVLTFEDEYYEQPQKFIEFAKNADVIVHLAGVNRHEPEVVYQKNIELMEKLLEYVDTSGNKPYIIFSSSTQIERDNPYGKGKKRAMEILEKWSGENSTPAVSMVVPNVFGDGGKPFYNSVVATFCHQITHNQQPKIDNDGQMTMVYINDLVEDIFELIRQQPDRYKVEYIKPRVEVKVSQILSLLEKFRDCYYGSGTVPTLKSDFERNLYGTFISYMDEADWQRKLTKNTDQRGSFVEVFKFDDAGQVSFSTTKPGITRGNHYHTRKSEKFCVVSGEASIKLRRIGADKVIDYKVSGDEPSWIEMPIYYTHNITNIGNSELLTLFWIDEPFDPADPDTFFEEV